MLRRIAVIVIAIMSFLAIALFVNTTSAANTGAPISCPGGQTVTKTASGWDCVNNGGNTSNAENPKNPNVGKGFF
jgi:hypothetical protein